MKSIILKISTVFLLITLIGTGCEKAEDLSYLDNSKTFDVMLPGFAIYKTKKDYFFNVSVTPFEDEILSPELKEGGSRITLYKDKYFYTERYRLNENYIVSMEIGVNSYFTGLNYDQYIKEKLAPIVGETNPKVISSISDRDPFTEFYYSSNIINGKSWITIVELNQIIKEKNLEKYFKKLK